MKLSLQQANRIIEVALKRSLDASYKPMAVVVLDDSGQLVSLQRHDGATVFRIDIAMGKAWASVNMGVSSRELVQKAQAMPAFFDALAVTGQGKFIPQTGAVLIQDATGRVLGAVGASGGTGDQDEEICLAGIEAVGLRAS
ncbi:GlcG/HbpS family heme-binding protein [Pseudomonas promysalinigenes]|uniref:GlcG/HbpS family heme-binding protein n=1 Tax=Pseudomonas promysalinigenes TaxID=485898 RepID=UPI0039173742